MIELLLAAERMLSVGMLDQAQRLFEQVAEADPRNSIAVVGLARIALEHGDEAGAIELARRALEIDPENVAAARMVERLEEVAATRAAATEPVPETTTAPEVEVPPEPVAVPTPEPVLPPAPPAPRPSWLRRLFDRLRRR